MKNVLFVCTSLATQGGISSVVKEFMSSKLNQQYNLYHLATHINGGDFIKITYLLYSYFLFPFVLLFKNIDIVHIHGGMRNSFIRKSYFLVIGKLFKKNVIFHMHSAMIKENIDKCGAYKKRIIIYLFNKYDAIIAISEYWKKIIQIYTKKDVYVIYNPIKLRAITSTKITSNTINVLTLGELGKRKGTNNIIKIAALLKDENIIFTIGGNGNIEHFKSLTKEYNVADKVFFKGWVSGKDKEDLLRKTDIYFLPSYFEGLPMSILEAMSYGLPVVSTKVGGIPEVIIHGCNGMIHQPDDLDGFKNSILELKDSPALMRQMEKNTLQIIRQFDIDEISEKLGALYEKFGKH